MTPSKRMKTKQKLLHLKICTSSAYCKMDANKSQNYKSFLLFLARVCAYKVETNGLCRGDAIIKLLKIVYWVFDSRTICAICHICVRESACVVDASTVARSAPSYENCINVILDVERTLICTHAYCMRCCGQWM